MSYDAETGRTTETVESSDAGAATTVKTFGVAIETHSPSGDAFMVRKRDEPRLGEDLLGRARKRVAAALRLGLSYERSAVVAGRGDARMGDGHGRVRLGVRVALQRQLQDSARNERHEGRRLGGDAVPEVPQGNEGP